MRGFFSLQQMKFLGIVSTLCRVSALTFTISDSGGGTLESILSISYIYQLVSPFPAFCEFPTHYNGIMFLFIKFPLMSKRTYFFVK